MLAVDHRFTITVDESELGLHLALAGLGLVGLAVLSSRVRPGVARVDDALRTRPRGA
ncbi:MAG: hypothetical protein GY937_15180 [bacterium]|nr:hypothetical protein [bacterium]